MHGKQQFENLISHSFSGRATIALALAMVFTLTVLLNQSAQAQTLPADGSWTEKLLHSFNGTDGSVPDAGLIFDTAGNLYGTTYYGGTYDYGTVFELTRSHDTAHGGWTEKVLHSFNGADGGNLFGGLILDAFGNLYGTGNAGGFGFGTVFELTRSPNTAGGGWTEKVLHSFNGTDGAVPDAALIFDAAGNLYGTTTYGGGLGNVFELTPAAGGGWTEKVLYNVGNVPFGGLIFDSAGNLYGTTYYGGTYGHGAVFELTPVADGSWTEEVLYSFHNNDADGAGPYPTLIFDAAGNLYGTTYNGGFYGYGTVFELMPAAGGGWTEKVLHSFNGTDGAYLFGGLIFDAAGNLYGTTVVGGSHGYGTVFELTPAAGGNWTEKVLYSFHNNGTDGAEPGWASLIFDAAGNLYGTTLDGGTYGYGTVFEITP